MLKSTSKTRHTRKRRRLLNARLRTGKQIVRHASKSGRTGTAFAKQLQSRSSCTKSKSMKEQLQNIFEENHEF